MRRDFSENPIERFEQMAEEFVRSKLESQEAMRAFRASDFIWYDWMAGAWNTPGACNFYREVQPSGFTISEFLGLAERARADLPEWIADRVKNWATEEEAWNWMFYSWFSRQGPEWDPEQTNSSSTSDLPQN